MREHRGFKLVEVLLTIVDDKEERKEGKPQELNQLIFKK